MDRSEVAEQVISRDGGRCVICGIEAGELHHLLDPRLWETGSSPAENVVVVCADHKRACQSDEIPVDSIRQAAGLAPCRPPQFYSWLDYDHWGNSLYSDGRRAKGELFDQPDVQEALTATGRIGLFGDWVRYPRTFVLPWSDETTPGDLRMETAGAFEGNRVIATEKMDGQNVTLYRGSFLFRSSWPRTHPSKEWMQDFWDRRKDAIPDGWRICGEFLYLAHTVQYEALDSYFVGFSVWNSENICLGWDDTKAFLADADIACAPVLFDGAFDRDAIGRAWRDRRLLECEGYVLRIADAITYRDFRSKVGKFIRTGYVQSDISNKENQIKNKLRDVGNDQGAASG
jgi:hypothetical protein